MALPNTYVGQQCSLSRALEIVGERWTLLIVRDAFYGVRRFSDFASHLNIPRAVLTERLRALADADVLERVGEPARRGEYQLTAKGISLWPVVRTLNAWGDDHYAPAGPRRLFRHATDEGPVDPSGRCDACGQTVPAADTVIAPGPGLPPPDDDDPISRALRQPHRLLVPLHS